MKLSSLLFEIFDDPYKYNSDFKTEEDPDYYDMDIDETYSKDVLVNPQLIYFNTDDNIKYLWYAKQNHFDEFTWHIAFGKVNESVEKNDTDELTVDISITGDKKAFRVFATVIAITNDFVEFAGNDVRTLTFTSEEESRTKLYKRILKQQDIIDNFKLDSTQEIHGETHFNLKRTHF